MKDANDNLFVAEGSACESASDGFCQNQFVDIHCHCLPGLDDGPATKGEAVALCRALAGDGINTVIATPHQLGRYSQCNQASIIRDSVDGLNEELRKNNIAITVLPGGDVRIDERICELLRDDKILTLADGGKYILLELPHGIFFDIEPLLEQLDSQGLAAIISHPERHHILAQNPTILSKWLNHSAHLQITAASLLGDFGATAKKTAWHLLSAGMVDFVATDAHDLQRRKPCLKAAFERINNNFDSAVANLVCIENPLRILQGRDIKTISTITTNAYE